MTNKIELNELINEYMDELTETWPKNRYENNKSPKELIRKIYEKLNNYEEIEAIHKILLPKVKTGFTFDSTATIRNNDELTILERDLHLDIINEGATEHHLIIGDNYNGLQNLLLTHKEKVQFIYIDPPYSTQGSKFTYDDSFESKDIWLNFMNERLRLAKSLLTNDGAIFVSIDDNMQAELKLLLDDIMGCDNHICTFSYKKGPGSNKSSYIKKTNEFIHFYAKNKSHIKINKIVNNENTGDSKLYNKGNTLRKLCFPKGSIWHKEIGKYNDEDSYIENEWKWSQEKVYEEIEKGTYFILKKENTKNVRYVRSTTETPFSNYIDDSDKKGNLAGDTRLRGIFNDKLLFTNPKSPWLIKYLMNLIKLNKNSVILDFFSGSGTTCDAVFQYNNDNKTNLSFIGIQLNEVIDFTGDNKKLDKEFSDGTTVTSIDQITYRRIRNLIQGETHWNEVYPNNSLYVHKLRKVNIGLNSNDFDLNDLLTNDSSYYKLNKDKSINFSEIYDLTLDLKKQN